ncbi:MAG: hypothetical protein IKF51_08080 [Solobacterium sp.]|nr:hypothetical protein [Solobacterium sp.]
MIHLLMCGTNYDGIWAADTLSGILHRDMLVGILPLSDDSGYLSDALEWKDRFREDGVFSYDLRRPLHSYGIAEKNIRILDHYHLEHWDPDFYDVIMLVGEDPAACMERLEDLGLMESLQRYRGILAGLSAGAQVQCSRFCGWNEDGYAVEGSGLGLLQNVMLDMHYIPDEEHTALLIRMLETQDAPVICVPEEGGVLVEEGRYLLFGDAFVLTDRDLDRLYERYSYLTAG